jgi:hypothetical protein
MTARSCFEKTVLTRRPIELECCASPLCHTRTYRRTSTFVAPVPVLALVPCCWIIPFVGPVFVPTILHVVHEFPVIVPALIVCQLEVSQWPLSLEFHDQRILSLFIVTTLFMEAADCLVLPSDSHRFHESA